MEVPTLTHEKKMKDPTPTKICISKMQPHPDIRGGDEEKITYLLLKMKSRLPQSSWRKNGKFLWKKRDTSKLIGTKTEVRKRKYKRKTATPGLVGKYF